MNKIIDGKYISNKIKEELKQEVSTFKTKPGLAVIQVGNNPASNTYVKNKKIAAEYIGINFYHIHYEQSTNEEIINKISELNSDKNIDGIIVQLPLPDEFNVNQIINNIAPEKDVDGLTNKNLGKLMNNETCLTSCTATGVMCLLKSYNVELNGKNVVVVGRSTLVGKPLSLLLLNSNATVTICHSKTKDLKSYTEKADILISACGQTKMIKKDMIKENAVIIDVGINRDQNNNLCGDVDFEEVYDKASLITPVPGGVGPMTVAMLNYNVIKSYKAKNN